MFDQRKIVLSSHYSDEVALSQSNGQLQYWFYGSFIQHKCIQLSVNVIMHNVEKTELTISYTTMP